MSSKVEKILSQAVNFEKLANDSLVSEAKKKENKLDPKAKVRNRGTVCVPAESAKDKKNHFPIKNEGQARNALARVHQYSSVPEWYSGSLKSLQDLVARKVKVKYPKIDVGGKDSKKKKSAYYDALLLKLAQQTVPTGHKLNTENVEQEWKDYEASQQPGVRQPVSFQRGGPGGDPNAIVNNEGKIDWSKIPADQQPQLSPPTIELDDVPPTPAKPAGQPAAKPSAYYYIPEVEQFQKWVLSQGSKELGPGGADGKLGPKTLASLLKRFPNADNDSSKALQDWMAYQAKMGYGKKPAAQPSGV